MAKNTKKTPAEILAELETRTARARARLALDMAQGNPIVEKAEALASNVTKLINANSRKLAGPTSFENRRKSTMLRLAWIDAEEALVRAEDAVLRANKSIINTAMADIATLLAAGKPIGENVIENIQDSLVSDPNIETLVLECNAAEKAWRAFTASLKADNAPVVGVNAAAESL